MLVWSEVTLHTLYMYEQQMRTLLKKGLMPHCSETDFLYSETCIERTPLGPSLVST